MGKNPFDIVPEIQGAAKSITVSAATGLKLGRAAGGWILKRRLEGEGFDPVSVDAAVEAFKAGRDPAPILEQARAAYEIRDKQSAMRRNPPPVHGSARWATVEEVSAAGLFRPTGAGLLNLGSCEGQPVNWNGESHLLTVAPTRTGKSTMQIIPNLLAYGGAAVVLDPKGELYRHTAAARERIGPVYVLNPFAMADMPATHAFNPLDTVTNSETALQLAEILYPRTRDDRQQFFDNEAIAFLAAALEFTARYAGGPHRNLGFIRDGVAALDKHFYGLIDAMMDWSMPASIRNAARVFQTKTRDTGKPRLIDSLNTHLRIWDNEGLRRATARSDFRFEALKDSPATVYLVLPFEKIPPYSTFVRMLFAAALDAMLRNPRKPDVPVLFVLDEFLALDGDDRFVSALRTHASAGVRLWFFLQDLPTLEQKYPTTWKSFLQAEAKTFFGTDDPHTAELISLTLGTLTVAYDVPNMSASTSGGASASAGYSLADNLHLTARRLMTPDEVTAFLRGNAEGRKAIHFLRDLAHPLATDLRPWFLNNAAETPP